MKYWIIVICEHENNYYYRITGKSFLQALESELEGQFEWARDMNMNAEDLYNWIKNKEGGEEVFVFESSSIIQEIDLF